MAWTNMSNKSNGVVVDQNDWNQLVANFSYLGGADGNTKTGRWLLSNNTAVAWRNQANTGDYTLTLNTGNAWIFNNGSSDVHVITAAGDIYGGGGATSMTTGFTYIPSSTGAPSGTPANSTPNRVPLYWDVTGNRLYGYVNGVGWRSVAMT